MSRFPAGFFDAIAGEERAKAAESEAPKPFAELTKVGGCLLSDMHQCLHRGEKCPECGYCFEEIG